MTAEIAIMNKSAVALAADSAVTFSVGGEQKVFQTVNKLFSISKYHPVGLMVYGNAEFMGIDWETIVKIYRNIIADRSFNTLRDYAYDFLGFLQSNQDLFDEPSQNSFVDRKIGYEFFSIRRKLIDAIDQEIEKAGETTSNRVRELLQSVITSHRVFLRNQDDIKLIDGKTLSSRKLQEVRNEYKPTIDRIKKMVFEKLPLDAGSSRKLTEIAIYALTKNDENIGRTSGVVVAGYGEHEIFPALEEFHVDGVFSNTLKFSRGRSSAIGREETASIIPFAQSEMVAAFMEGVEPEYQRLIDRTVRATLESYRSTLLDLLAPNSTKERDRYAQAMSQANEDLAQNFGIEMKEYRDECFVQPVVDIVEQLPKSELAAMAESLVNLTSFRRHVTPDVETVGGPIDVAVISRGDGFIWIKRKHYFQPELNQHFFKNYFREVSNGEREADD